MRYGWPITLAKGIDSLHSASRTASASRDLTPRPRHVLTRERAAELDVLGHL